MATVSASVAGLGGLSEVLTARGAGTVAILAAAAAGCSAALSPRTMVERATQSANSYRSLQQDVRLFLNVDLGALSAPAARETLGQLIARQQLLNRQAAIPSARAWKRAKKQIESGSQDYEADK